MTNNQRFLAELAVLLLIGGAIYAKASPSRQDKQVTPEVVRAQKFELVDKDGKLCATLGTVEGTGEGSPPIKMTTLTLTSGQGKEQEVPAATMVMGVMDNGLQLFSMVNTLTKVRIEMRIRVDGTPEIKLLGKDGKTRTLQP